MSSRNRRRALGKRIVAYVPDPLLKTAWRFLLTATLAAALWSIAEAIGIRYVDAVIALVALVPTFKALALFLRLVRPGKRIAVHDHGVILGRRSLLWEEIEKVEYHLDLGSEYSSPDTRYHDFTFRLTDGKSEWLRLDDGPLPTYVDVDRFRDLLYVATELVDLAMPTVQRVAAGETPARDPVLAEQLRGLLTRVEAAPARGVLSAQAEQALRQGERRRGRLARNSTLLVLLLIALGLISGLATAVLVTLGFFSGVGLLATFFGALDAFDLFEPINALGGFRLPAMALLFASSWWSAGKASTLTEDTYKELARQNALSGAFRSERALSSREALLSLLESGEPFALYLRSFSDEFFQYLQPGLPHVSGVEIPEYEGIARDFDITLISTLSDEMPVFGLANAADASSSSRLRRLFVENEQWFDTVAELAREASAVVVHLGSVTEGLMAELELLDRAAAKGKTLLIRGEQFSESGLSEVERARVLAFQYQLDEDALSEGGPILEFLALLSTDSPATPP